MSQDLLPDLLERCRAAGVDRLTAEKLVELIHGYSKQEFVGEFIETRYDERERDLEELRSISYRGRREYEKVYFRMCSVVKNLYDQGQVRPVYPGVGFDPDKDEFTLVALQLAN